MSIFRNYLHTVPDSHCSEIERIIAIVQNHVSEAKEGLSYGLPAFKFNNRPLIGFSSNKYGLNIYPFDPRIISAVKPELEGFETSKGVVRFTPLKPIPEKIVLLMMDMRLEYLKKQMK